MMSEKEAKKTKKAKASLVEALSWQQKKALADGEEEAIGKEVDELKAWTTLIENMDEKQMKEYVLNRPEHLESSKTGKGVPRKRVQKNRKSKCSSASLGLMASIWKFHREDDD